jgi:hypothetical protein
MVPVRYRCTVHSTYRVQVQPYKVTICIFIIIASYLPVFFVLGVSLVKDDFMIIFFREIACLSSNKLEQQWASMCLKVTNGEPAPRLATLLLEDGTRFTGTSFGAAVSMAGEVGAVLLALAIFKIIFFIFYFFFGGVGYRIFLFFCTIFNTDSSAAPQISLCRRIYNNKCFSVSNRHGGLSGIPHGPLIQVWFLEFL